MTIDSIEDSMDANQGMRPSVSSIGMTSEQQLQQEAVEKALKRMEKKVLIDDKDKI